MAKKKSPATKKNPNIPENPIKVIKEDQCQSLEGSANLTYQIGTDESGAIHFKITDNSGGGFWSAEWIAFDDIQAAFKAWGDDTPITSMALRPLFKGKSVNTPSFMNRGSKLLAMNAPPGGSWIVLEIVGFLGVRTATLFETTSGG